jgi:hypothetical protein
MSAFRGFPPKAIEFLRELEANNDRDWFKANRARYDEHLLAPAAALGEDLADLGRPRLFRPWNDTRFRPGPPIKEQVGLAIGYEGAGGFYVEISLDGLLIAAGLHNPAPDQVDRLRQAVDTGRTAAPLTRAIACAGRGPRAERPRPRARTPRIPRRAPPLRAPATAQPHHRPPPRDPPRAALPRPSAVSGPAPRPSQGRAAKSHRHHIGSPRGSH